MTARWLVAGVVVIAMAGTAGVAGAAPSEAEARFEEGRALVKAGQPADAVPKFLASIAAKKTAVAILNLADCYERLGKTASAYARFREAEQLSEGDATRADEARRRAEALEPHLATVVLVAEGPTAGVRAQIDGDEVKASRWIEPLPLDAGAHTLVVTAPSGATKTTPFRVVDGKRTTLTVDMPQVAALPPPPPDTPPPPPPSGAEPAHGSTMKTVGIVTAGAGGVAIVAGTVIGFLAIGASHDLKSTCPAYPTCPAAEHDRAIDLDDRARSLGTASTITLVAGGVLAVAGAVLFFTAPPSEMRSSARGFEWVF